MPVLLFLLALANEGRTFQIEQRYSVPASSAETMVFVPLPFDDVWQKSVALEISRPYELVHDVRSGSAAARIQMPMAGGEVIVRFRTTRLERGASAKVAREPAGRTAPFLSADRMVPIDARVQKIASEVTHGKSTPLEKARAIYDYVLATMKYDKPAAQKGWGQGDILWACDKKFGNCTDFHALFIGLLRASGIPARFEIGYSLPGADSGELPGYHCWADFYVDGTGWIPVDASEAWKHPEKREYFFGHHDADRFALSRGRDLVFPGMRGEPLNFFIYGYAEANGQPVPVSHKTTFTAVR